MPEPEGGAPQNNDPGDPQGGGAATVPNSGSQPDPKQTQPNDFIELVPEEYREKPWVKETKDLKGLFKRTDDLITEVGKKPAGIPQDNASEEEWESFNKAWGVPEDPKEYELSGPPEGLEKNEKFEEGIRGVFKKAGVSSRQAKVLESGYNELISEIVKETSGNAQQQDVNFDELAGKVFGQDKEVALKKANALITKFTPKDMKPHLEKLSNENLIVLAGVLNGVAKEYIGEDQLPSSGNIPAGMTQDQKQERGRELMSSKAYNDAFHPDHQKVRQEVERLYGTTG